MPPRSRLCDDRTAKQIVADETLRPDDPEHRHQPRRLWRARPPPCAGLQRNNNNVWMVTASPTRSTLTECLCELATELGMENALRQRNPGSRTALPPALHQRPDDRGGRQAGPPWPRRARRAFAHPWWKRWEAGMVLVGNSRVLHPAHGRPPLRGFHRLTPVAKNAPLTKAKG